MTKLYTAFILLMAFIAISTAQQSEVAKLNGQIEELSISGKYSEAISLAQRALSIIEPALRHDDPHLAPALTRLADLYAKERRYTDAEPLYLRALAIREKGLGPDHVDVASSLRSLAAFYTAQGREADAQPLIERASAIEQKAAVIRRTETAKAPRRPQSPIGVR
jgi:tetratricopeptide (TPR) repeat protein